jgi:hypothetical protein
MASPLPGSPAAVDELLVRSKGTEDDYDEQARRQVLLVAPELNRVLFVLR